MAAGRRARWGRRRSGRLRVLAEVGRRPAGPLGGIGSITLPRRPVAQFREEREEGARRDGRGHDERQERPDLEVEAQRPGPGDEGEQQAQPGESHRDPATGKAHLHVGECRKDGPGRGEEEQHEAERHQAAEGEAADAVTGDVDAEVVAEVHPRQDPGDQVEQRATGDDVVRDAQLLEVRRDRAATADRLPVGIRGTGRRAVTGWHTVTGWWAVARWWAVTRRRAVTGRPAVTGRGPVPRWRSLRRPAVRRLGTVRRLSRTLRRTARRRLWGLAGRHRRAPRRASGARLVRARRMVDVPAVRRNRGAAGAVRPRLAVSVCAAAR